jgi:hypothetical protein
MIMKTKQLSILAFSFMFSVTLFSCKKNKDDAPSPQNNNEQEQITTLRVIVSEGSTVVDTFSFTDIDGPGGNAPTIENINLTANKSYSARLLLLDESKNPVDTISSEVAEEAEEHQFFYTVSSANLTVTPTDEDANGVPVGLEATFDTGAASTGNLTIVLKHQPELKPTTGDGDSSLGETDVEVTFSVNITN